MADGRTGAISDVHFPFPTRRTPTTYLSQWICPCRPQLTPTSHKYGMASPTGGVHETCSLGCAELPRCEAHWRILGYCVDAWDAQRALVVPPEQPRSAVHVHCHHLTTCARRVYCCYSDIAQRAQDVRLEEVRAAVGSGMLEFSTPTRQDVRIELTRSRLQVLSYFHHDPCDPAAACTEKNMVSVGGKVLWLNATRRVEVDRAGVVTPSTHQSVPPHINTVAQLQCQASHSQ